MDLRGIWQLIQNTIGEWNRDNASRLAAALAYYTIFSLAPVLILVVAIAGFFFGQEAARGEIVSQIQGLVGRSGAEVIQTAIENANRPGENSGTIATIIGVVILLFAATGMFVQLQDSLNEVWNVKPRPGRGIRNFARKRLLSFAMIVGIGFLLLVSLVVSALLSGFSDYVQQVFTGFETLLQVVNFAVSFLVITLLFALVYKYIPDVKIEWGDVWIGAALTALLFSLGKYLIGLYLGNSSFSSTYGAAGSLVALLAWIYYSSQILFLGAEFTQVYARQYGSQIVPDKNAMRTDRSPRENQLPAESGGSRSSGSRDRRS
ncbi:MAG: YihY/virulence factor BrkB family protein [Elainellaceae cyanobacterium]